MSLVIESLHSITFLNIVNGLSFIVLLLGAVVLVRRIFAI